VIGRVLSHYRIVGALGAGGMGVIYRAEDDRLGRAVALKFLPDELAHDRQAIERLRAEARAASALNHSNICTVYDIGEDDGRPFIVMELLTGRNVRDLLASGPLKITQVVDIGIQIADALDAAHRDGIIHRDIKPANIFLTDRHQAKLLDFGVAKLTEARGASGSTTSSTGGAVDLTVPGVTVGTVAYMSPEQATGETLDGRTDLFSLGVVLYECATGHHPFTGKTTALVLSSILNRAPVAPVVLNPELPPHLQDIIQNCLEKDRELRYQSAADLRADLRRLRRDLESGLSRTIETDPGRTTVTLAATHAAHTVASQPREALPRRSSRRVGAWIAVGSIAVVLAVIGDVLIHRGQPTAPVLVPTVSPSASSSEPAAVNQAVSDAASRAPEPAQQADADTRAAAPPAAPLPPSRRPEGLPASRSASSSLSPSSPPPSSGGPSSRAGASIAPPASESAAPPPSIRLPAVREFQPVPSPLKAPAPTPSVQQAQPPAESARSAPPPPAPTEERSGAPKSGPTAEEDEAVIRRALSTYARAIENKDIGLFRSVKPNLSNDEQRRLEEGFRAVTRQKVALTVLSIDRRGPRAVVALKRVDTITAGGRDRTVESQQTVTLERSGDGWIISEIR
jgi:serine/threonine protein kinase